MAFKTGKANGYKEMLLALKGFLTSPKKAFDAAPGGGNTGDGFLSAERASTSPVDETWTLTATSATNFTVTGSVSGAQAAATVGTPYDNSIVAFTIVAGSTAFVSSDSFTFDVADGLGTTEDWTVKSWDTDWDGNGNYELILMAPGTSGTDEIYVGIQTYFDAGDDYYNWRLQGYTGYSAQAGFNTQPGAMTDAPDYNPKILLWDDLISYWIIGNGRRFALVAKVSTIYESMFMGFLLPYGIPNQIPYPLAIGGTCRAYYDDEKRWSNVQPEHRAFFDAFGEGSFRTLHGGTWLNIRNFSGGETGMSSTQLSTWPYLHSNYHLSWTIYPANWIWKQIQQNIDGSYPSFPVIVHGASPEINIYGELQGIFAVPGFSLAAEDTIVDGGDTYLVVPNVFRNDMWDYMAMLLE